MTYRVVGSSSVYNQTTAYAGGKLAVVQGLQKGTGEPGLTDAKNLYNRSVVGWDDAQRGNFLAFEGLAMMVANGAHSSKLMVSCSHSFSQSNSVPCVWMIRDARTRAFFRTMSMRG